MSSFEKNLITEFIELGANSRNAAITYHVYMELCEVRHMFEMNYYYNGTLKKMVLTAKTSKSAPVSIFLPISTSENTSLNLFCVLNQLRRLFKINYHYNDTLKRMFLTAKTSKSAPVSTFIPISTAENTSFDLLEQMVAIDPQQSIYLAMVSSDTTCVFYNLTTGLVDLGLDKSSNLNRRQKRDSEIIMKRNDIEKNL